MKMYIPPQCERLKVDSQLPKNILWFNESSLQVVKNTFYFILKALLDLKIFKFLSWLFRHIEKMRWLERYG